VLAGKIVLVMDGRQFAAVDDIAFMDISGGALGAKNAASQPQWAFDLTQRAPSRASLARLGIRLRRRVP